MPEKKPDAEVAATEPAEQPKPRPKGEPEGVVKIREVIEGKLAQLVDKYFVDEHGNYVLGIESARVFIVPTWVENGSTVIRVFAITNLDVPITPELTTWLLEKNLEFVFGGFALDASEGAVWFNHNMLGDFAHPEALEATLAAVTQTADQYDDEIKSRFGGRLYVETKDQAVPTPATPGYL
jgi:Putative bacterial sensory transduction regulator